MTERTRLPLPDPDGSVWVGGWVQQGYVGKSMHAYADACLAQLVCALSAEVDMAPGECQRMLEIEALRAELARTNEQWEKSHQIALAIQDERDAQRKAADHWMEEANQEHNENARLAGQVQVLREALTEVLEFQSAPKQPTIHDYGRWRRAALEATK